jgi:hypothetical protein
LYKARIITIISRLIILAEAKVLAEVKRNLYQRGADQTIGVRTQN